MPPKPMGNNSEQRWTLTGDCCRMPEMGCSSSQAGHVELGHIARGAAFRCCDRLAHQPWSRLLCHVPLLSACMFRNAPPKKQRIRRV
jgi:hypothetical protein